MTPRRRLVMQLTSLLDLMLIITFGQHMVARYQRAVERETGQDSLTKVAELQQQLTTTSTRAEIAELEKARHQAELSQARTDLEQLLARQQRIGELLVRLFKLPPEIVAQALDPARSPANPPTPADVARLKERFEQFAQQSPGAMIEHLLSYDEIRKRCDVWELYVDSTDTALIDMGQAPIRMRIPVTTAGEVDAAAFESDLYARYKGLPQPKTLVILLLTYDRGTRISVTQPLRAMLPRLISRMQADSIGRSRFEYADLGFKIR